MEKDKIMAAVGKVKSALSELESACGSGMEMAEEEESEETGSEDSGAKKSMIVAMMKKKMGSGE